MRLHLLLLFCLILTCLLFGCASAPPAAAPTPLGVQVRTPDGVYTNVTPTQLHMMLEDKDFLLINVNTPYVGAIEKTNAFVPFDVIGREIKQYALDQETKLVLYGQSGSESTRAAEMLVRLGYTNVYNLDGGMEAWQKAGYPLVQQ